MSKHFKKILSLILALSMLLTLAACAANGTESTPVSTGNETEAPTAAPTEEPTEAPTEASLDFLKVEILEQYDGKANGYTFRVGAGKGIITPSIGTTLCGYTPARDSEKLNDDLNVVVFAFEQDGLIMLTIDIDTCNVGDLPKSLPIMLSLQTGVPEENIMFAAVHTHSGPYTTDTTYNNKILIPAAVQAAKDAISGLQWAEMGANIINSQVGCNRRETRSSDNYVKLGQDPNGPYDPTMTVISFKNHSGEIIGNIVHYGAHNTGSGKNIEITRDWCGVMKDALEEKTGGITAFFNGAQGDVGPRLSNGGTTGSLSLALELGEIAAIDSVNCWNGISNWKKDCKLSQISGTVSIPYAEIPSVEEMQAELDELKSVPSPNNDVTSKITGLEAAITLKQSGRSFTSLDLETRLFALGDVCFAPSQFETFANPILDIRSGSPYPYTIVISNSMGHQGYFPTEDELSRGGYEIQQYWKRTSSKGTPWLIANGTEYFVDQYLTMIRQMKEQ